VYLKNQGAYNKAVHQSPQTAPSVTWTIKLTQLAVICALAGLGVRLTVLPEAGVSDTAPRLIYVFVAMGIFFLLPWASILRSNAHARQGMALTTVALCTVYAAAVYKSGSEGLWAAPVFAIFPALALAITALAQPMPPSGLPSKREAWLIAAVMAWGIGLLVLAVRSDSLFDPVFAKRAWLSSMAVFGVLWLYFNGRMRGEALLTVQQRAVVLVCVLTFITASSTGFLFNFFSRFDTPLDTATFVPIQLMVLVPLIAYFHPTTRRWLVPLLGIVLVSAIATLATLAPEQKASGLAALAITLHIVLMRRSHGLVAGAWAVILGITYSVAPQEWQTLLLTGMAGTIVLMVCRTALVWLPYPEHAPANPLPATDAFGLRLSSALTLPPRAQLGALVAAAVAFVVSLYERSRHLSEDGLYNTDIQIYILWSLLVAVVVYMMFVTYVRANLRRAAMAQTDQMRAILDTAKMGFRLYTLTGDFVWANAFTLQRTEQTFADLQGTNLFTENIAPVDDGLPEAARRVVAGESVVTFEAARRSPSGVMLYAEIRVERVRMLDQDLLMVQINDVSEVYKQKQEREVILNTASVGLGHARDRKWVWVNPRLAELMGYTVEEMVGQETRVIFADEAQWHAMADEYARQVAQGHRILKVDLKMRRKDGAVRDMRVQLALLDLERLENIASYDDVTEELAQKQRTQEALAQARASDEAKTVFLRTMSHEVRTPLNGIMGAFQIIEGTERLSPKGQHLIQTGMQTSEQLLAILNDVLDIAKLSSEGIRFNAQRVDLHAVLTDAVNTLNTLPRDAGVNLTVALDTNTRVFAVADPVRLKQVVLNLAGNALKFTHDGTVSVQANCERAGDGTLALTIQVKDTGIGMSEALQARLFQPFVQGDTTFNRKYEGTGLGLVIVREIAKAMGGDVTVHSQEGVGSTFTAHLILPIGAESNSG
jgi:PAS domain S-box-containing protein